MAVHLRPSGELGVDARATEKVEGKNSLWEEAIPEVEGEIRVSAAEAGNEVVFKGTNGALGSVCAMHAGRDELKVDGFVAQKLFESGGAFVVEALELGAEAGVDEAIVDGFVGSEDGGGCFAGHGFSMDGIAVVVVQQEKLCVAGAGGDDEAAGLVGEDLTIGG
jgi:hypothetical protein